MIGIGVGVVFAIFARFFQKIVIVVAGFFLGGSILSGFIGALGIDVTWLSWIIGGLIGVLLVSILFDWALISLSSIGGAVLLVQSFNLGNPVRGVAFIVLLFFGFFIQATSMRKEKKTSNEVAK